MVGTLPRTVQTESNPVAKTRLHFLDAVRGVSAFAVLIQHGAAQYWPAFSRFSAERFDLGRLGITLFFLTSGFLIPATIERGNSLRRFWQSRFFRLYPLYWLSLALVLVLSTVQPHALNYADHSVGNALVNVTMFQEFVGVPHAIQLYYTLTIELAFYVACSALFAVGLLRRSVLLSGFAIAGVGALGVVAPLVLERRAPMLGLFALMSMFFGSVVFRYLQGRVSLHTVGVLLLGIVAVTIPGVYVNYVRYPKMATWDRHTFIAEFAPWVVAYVAFFIAFVLRKAEVPAVLGWLGRISYSIYLMHPLVLIVTEDWSNPVLSMTFLVGATLMFATFTYYVIEKPLIDLGRRLGSSPRHRAASRTAHR